MRAAGVVLLTFTVLGMPCAKRSSSSSAEGGDSGAPAPDVTLSLYVNEGRIAPPKDGLDVIVDGKALGRVTETGTRSVKLDAPASALGLDLAPRIRARLKTTCGDEDYFVTPHYTVREQEIEAQQKYVTAATKNDRSFYVDGVKYARVWIDNIGGKAKAIKIGELAIDVAADAKLDQRIRLGKCATARAVSIDGKTIGELNDKTTSTDPKTLPASLVDAVGGRCYREKMHRYKWKGTAGSGAPPAPPVTHKGARVYAIDPPTDFLTTSPKEYEQVTLPGELNLPFDSRREINRCEGTPKTGGKLR